MSFQTKEEEKNLKKSEMENSKQNSFHSVQFAYFSDNL